MASVQEAEKEIGGEPRRLFHLAVPPVAFQSVVEMLGASGLAQGSRVIIEKPFGTDLASARALNGSLHKVFDESQIFRIDHFLGKESVDNILALRFANGLFEPVWNREHIEYVQIDVPEKLSIEGRAAFYEGTGAFRDMVVTHLFQVLGFVAMEPPTRLSAQALGDERQKVFDSMKPIDTGHVVRGQYTGYRIGAGSTARFGHGDVCGPARRDRELAVGRGPVLSTHRQVPRPRPAGGYARVPGTDASHVPVPRSPALLGPTERGQHRLQRPGLDFGGFLAKVPGAEMRLGEAKMVFRYEDSFCAKNGLEGYERLILDAMLGDQSLFTSAGQVERLWEVSAPLLENPPPVQPYARGSWGPQSVDRLIAPHHWHLPDL